MRIRRAFRVYGQRCVATRVYVELVAPDGGQEACQEGAGLHGR